MSRNRKNSGVMVMNVIDYDCNSKEPVVKLHLKG